MINTDNKNDLKKSSPCELEQTALKYEAVLKVKETFVLILNCCCRKTEIKTPVSLNVCECGRMTGEL